MASKSEVSRVDLQTLHLVQPMEYMGRGNANKVLYVWVEEFFYSFSAVENLEARGRCRLE